jgi:hypothetical protein
MFAMGTLQQAGTNLGWLWYVLLGLVLLVLIVWALFRRVKRMEVEALAEPPTTPRKQTQADDLTKIEGIGPKVAQVLKEAGITTFAALSQAEVEELKKSLHAAGLQMMNPEGWIEQAELAAKGDWAELRKLQDELKGGRRE